MRMAETDTSVTTVVPDTKPDLRNIFDIHNEPVMKNALDVLSLFGKNDRIILRAKGNSIPNAVAVANIITEKMMKDKSKVQKIIVDSEIPEKMGRMISTIEIMLSKVN